MRLTEKGLDIKPNGIGYLERYQKLSQLEDILEKYNIDSPELLDLDLKTCHKLVYEYGQLEEELGIDLITLFKAISCGAYQKGKDGMLDFNDCKLLYKRIQIGNTVHWLSNYGKTWALTKEELK